MNRFFGALLLLFFYISAHGSNGLVAGPMQGHTTATSTYVWIMVEGHGEVTLTLVDDTGTKVAKRTQSTGDFKGFKDFVPLTFAFKGLTANSQYKAVVTMNGETFKPDTPIKTLDDNPEKSYQFIVTSCALTVPVGLRWIHPGIEERVYKYAAETPSEFTLWLGDYLYYLPKHSRSQEGMYKRFSKKRLQKKMMVFMQSQPHYAIYDDHDFGPNDSDGSFALKKEAVEVFKNFFPNPYPDKQSEGIYFNFQYKDSEFFMTDDRYFRTTPEDTLPGMLGEKQMEWLKEELLNSTATFKFIGVGSQALNQFSANESYWFYETEVNSLIDFVIDNQIDGVIFLSGDRHHSELLKLTDLRDAQYPFYEFTSSGITSFRRRTRRTSESKHIHRVPNTLADFQNYGRISIDGPMDDRTCTFEIFNKRGKQVWTYTVHANDLKFDNKTISVQPKPQDK